MPRDIPSEFSKNWEIEIGGVPCGIYIGPNPENASYGISESTGIEGARATVYFICYWDDRLALTAGLLGTVQYSTGVVQRTDPFPYPVAEEDQFSEDNEDGVFNNRLFCTGIPAITGIKPWTDEDGDNVGLEFWLGYIYAVVQAEFTQPPYLIEDLLGPGMTPEDPSFNDLTYQTYIVSNVRVSGEVFSPPTGSFVFSTGDFAAQPLLDVGASQIRTRFEISITRVRMPLVPMQTITKLIGTVNQAQFLVGGELFPTGAMLFTGINPQPRSDPYNGGIVWDVELMFQANGPASNGGDGDDPLDWNFFLDPGGKWSKVTTKAGDPVFQYADHTQLYSDTIN